MCLFKKNRRLLYLRIMVSFLQYWITMPITTCYGFVKRYTDVNNFKKNIIRHSKAAGVVVVDDGSVLSLLDFSESMPKLTRNNQQPPQKRLCIETPETVSTLLIPATVSTLLTPATVPTPLTLATVPTQDVVQKADAYMPIHMVPIAIAPPCFWFKWRPQATCSQWRDYRG